MSNYNILKTNIAAQIKQNGAKAITGQILQTHLLSMITSLGAGYQYMGVAALNTNPGTPDYKCFYIATAVGTYSNFGSPALTVAQGEVAIFYYDTAWHKAVTGAASKADVDALIQTLEGEVSELGHEVDDIALGGALSLKKVGFPNPGRYLVNGTLSQTGWHHTDLIEVDNSTPVSVYVNEGGSTSTPVVIYYDENQSQIGYELAQGTGNQFVTRSYTAPANAKYIRAQSSGDETKAFVTYQRTTDGLFELQKDIETANDGITNNANGIASLDTEINSVENLFAPWLLSIVGFARTDGTIGTNTGYHRTDYLDVTNIKQVSLYIGGAVVPAIVWYDASKAVLGYERLQDNTPTTIVSVKPAGARYMIVSVDDSYRSIVNGSAIVNSIKDCVYLSTSGADNNAGTESAPLATAFGAKSYGAEKVIFLAGDYKDFAIDFGLFGEYEFRKGARLICGTRFDSATLASGYTMVYQVAYTPAITASFLWQHDVADAATLIDASEYLPIYHCGRKHRLSSTRLYKATSIAEIESTTGKYMWYQTGGVLYFSAPSSDFATHPIVIPDNSNKVYGSSWEKDVRVVGLNVLYRTFNSYRLNGRFDGGFVGFSDYTCFRFNSNKYLELNCFECAGGNPDGFGGGFADNVNYDIVMKNCYGHDNADDGESGHVKTNITQYGGLYEYNGSGVTPAVGSMGSYYNTICRNNGVHDWTVGFQDGGGFTTAQGNDPKTYILCVGCLSENNKVGFSGNGSCINCVAKNNANGNFSASLTQYNCASLE